MSKTNKNNKDNKPATLSKDEVERLHAAATAPRTFYYENGGRFKNQRLMTHEEELAYVERIYVSCNS